jgi:hypothetical protein
MHRRIFRGQGGGGGVQKYKQPGMEPWWVKHVRWRDGSREEEGCREREATETGVLEASRWREVETGVREASRWREVETGVREASGPAGCGCAGGGDTATAASSRVHESNKRVDPTRSTPRSRSGRDTGRGR